MGRFFCVFTLQRKCWEYLQCTYRCGHGVVYCIILLCVELSTSIGDSLWFIAGFQRLTIFIDAFNRHIEYWKSHNQRSIEVQMGRISDVFIGSRNRVWVGTSRSFLLNFFYCKRFIEHSRTIKKM